MRLLLENLLFTLVVPGTIAVYVPLLLVRGHPPATGPAVAAGVALLAMGAAIYAWCVWDFATIGRGTPAPMDAPRRLVVRGPYRWCRNPMYVGVLASIAGWAAVFAAPALALYAGAVALGFHAFVLLHEERALRRRFGSEYARYCERVPRWWPRWPGRRGEQRTRLDGPSPR